MSVYLTIAQINTLVGDIPGNTAKVLASARAAIAQGAVDAVIFPELTLTGYPPEDLLLRPSLGVRIERALDELIAAKPPARHAPLHQPFEARRNLRQELHRLQSTPAGAWITASAACRASVIRRGV